MRLPRPASYHLEFRFYQRRFLRPLITAHGLWSVREGVIVRLTDRDGRIGYGEAAPVPGFTSETTANDLKWLRRAGSSISTAVLRRAPRRLAALRWALSNAQAMIQGDVRVSAKNKPWPVAGLLPAGELAATELKKQAAHGYHVFKWKVGLAAPPLEFSILEKLLASLPAGGRIRLDANGALSQREWSAWCDGLNSLGPALRAIEFFEQPLPMATGPLAWREQVRLAAVAPVPVALDESVAGLSALQRARAVRWPGLLVVKPSLVGDRTAFIQWRGRSKTEIVYSSAFETSVGLQATLGVTDSDPQTRQRALGFGTLDAFGDDGLQLPVHAAGPILVPVNLTAKDFLGLWNRLSKPI